MKLTPSAGRVLLCAAMLAGCGDDNPTPADAGVGDATTPMDGGATCDNDLALPEVPSGMAHADPLGAGPGEVRAGVVTAAMLPEVDGDLLTWAPGDYVLANDRVAFVIEDAGPSDGYEPFGGKLVGIASVEGGAMVRPADFNELITGVSTYLLDANTVDVASDGSDGRAIVRVRGQLSALPFAADLIGLLAPGDFSDMGLAIDYILEADSNKLEVRYHLLNPRTRLARWNQLMMAFQGNRMPMFGPEQGFAVEGSPEWLGFVEEGATSFIMRYPNNPVQISAEISGASVLGNHRLEAEACSLEDFVAMEFIAGGPGADGVIQALRAEDGVAEREVRGEVRRENGDPADGVYVHIETADGEQWLTRTRTDADGRFVAHVADDAGALRVRTWEPAAGERMPVMVGAGDTTVTIEDLGTLRVEAREDGDNVPVRVAVRPEGGVVAPPGRFGQDPWTRGRSHVEFPANGNLDLSLPAGRYRVTVSRGFEYELGFDEVVDIVADEITPVMAIMDRVVDTTDVMCADFHIHTNRSPDSEDDAAWKLRSAAADGLELPCRSDHEWIYDWDHIAELEAVQEHVVGITSLELTTFQWGHFGVVPMESDPDALNRGAVPWVGRSPSEVFADAQGRSMDPVLIVNHPRGSSGLQAYFTAVGYDPVTGMVENEELWDESFDAIEAFNDSSFRSSSEEVADWFSFLNQGKKVWAVGSSDTHSLHSSPVGYPRTCLRLGEDDPMALRASNAPIRVRDAVRDGQFTVSGGIFLDVLGRDGVRPGGTVMGAASMESIRVRVSAASWVDATTLEVYVNGMLSQTIPLADGAMSVVRFEDDIEIAVSDGDWVVFHAYGEEPLMPVHSNEDPFAVSMPIFFEN